MNLRNKIFHNSFFILMFVVLFSACEKETDKPPMKSLDPNSIITLDSLRNIYYHYGHEVRFDEDFFNNSELNPSGVNEYNIYAVVTMSQESGNIYRQAYVQDETAAINVRFSRPGVSQGDSIRINLKNTVVSEFSGMLQLDDVDATQNIVKLREGINFPPAEVGIQDILSGKYQAHLVKLDNVQFAASDVGKTFADAQGLNTINRTLEDCFGNSIIVRTSGYADFAARPTPAGNGSLVAIAGVYSPDWQDYDTWQLYIRTYEEIDMDGPRCGDVEGELIFAENFDDGDIGQPIDFNNWKSYLIEGSRHWITSTTGARNYAQISAYGSGDDTNIAWLTSAQVNAQNYETTALVFETSHVNFAHDGLEVFISYNFNEENPESATWTELTDAYIVSSNNNPDVWVSSGVVEINNQEQNYHIGFKYTGSDTDGLNTLFRVDNVKVYGY